MEARNTPEGQRTPRAAATAIARRLIDAGFTAFFAGGCVRDRLRGEDPSDYDIATDARPEQIRQLFPSARGVGESFGVMLVRRSGFTIEVATFRSDGVYSDGRHPDEVTFSDAEHDARRRDFTINGLFEHPLTGEIIDYVEGRADLERGVIRCIGDPFARLREDQLRMLRAARFAARFDFALDPATTAAIQASAGALRGVSRERIGQELRLMLAHPRRVRAASLVESLGLDASVFDEPHQAVDHPSLEAVDATSPFVPALAAWLVDRHGPGPEWQEVVRRWTRSLVLSNAERREMQSILSTRDDLRTWAGARVARRKRIAARESFGPALRLIAVETPSAAAVIGEDVRELAETGLAPPPFVDGDVLIETLRLAPGPRFKELLEAVYDAQLEGEVRSVEEAVEWVRRRV